jgi:hypothetical protein
MRIGTCRSKPAGAAGVGEGAGDASGTVEGSQLLVRTIANFHGVPAGVGTGVGFGVVEGLEVALPLAEVVGSGVGVAAARAALGAALLHAAAAITHSARIPAAAVPFVENSPLLIGRHYAAAGRDGAGPRIGPPFGAGRYSSVARARFSSEIASRAAAC